MSGFLQRCRQIVVASASLAAQSVTLAKLSRTGATLGKVITGAGAGSDPTWETPAAASIAAADITDAGAAGVSLVQSATAAAAQSAAGLAPATLAAQARAVSATRRGPVAMTEWSDSAYVAPLAAPATQPSVVRGSSGVVVVYSPTAGGYANTHLAASHDVGGTRGWILGVSGGDLYLYSPSGTVQVLLTGSAGTVGWHSVAWSISAGGAVRYSIDAAAVAAGVGAPLLTARDPADSVRIGRGVYNAVPSSIPIAYLAVWASVLSDADLVINATAPSAGAPSLTSTPAWEWAAAAHLGCDRVSVGSGVYAVVGAPVLWMP